MVKDKEKDSSKEILDLLVLPGGGAKGDYQAGVIAGLREQGYEADIITTISVGALNGIKEAVGEGHQLESIWKNIYRNQVFKKRGVIHKGFNYALHKLGIGKAPLGYYDTSPLRELIVSNLEGRTVKKTMFAGVVNLNTRDYIEEIIKAGWILEKGSPFLERTVDIVMASAAIPVVFDPIKRSNPPGLYVDGGIRVQSPIGHILRSHNIGRVVVIPTGNLSTFEKYYEIRDIIGIAESTIGTLVDEVFQKDYREFTTINWLVKQAKEHNISLKRNDGSLYHYYPTAIAWPNKNLGTALNFEAKKSIENFNYGYSRGLSLNLPDKRTDGGP